MVEELTVSSLRAARLPLRHCEAAIERLPSKQSSVSERRSEAPTDRRLRRCATAPSLFAALGS